MMMMDDRKERELAFYRDSAVDAQKVASSKVSELARYVGLGLASLIFIFASSSSDFAEQVFSRYKVWIALLSITGAAVILLDYVQYIYGYQAAREAAMRVEEVEKGRYDIPHIHNKLTHADMVSRIAFSLKQRIAVAGIITFAGLLFWIVFVAGLPIAKAHGAEFDALWSF
jgi:hypothetical protein